MTGNRHDAEELMQDAFLKLWEPWDTTDSIGDLTGYLFRVALNGFRSRRRRAAVAIRKVTPIPEDRDAFLDAEMRADVRQLLLGVTPRQRAAPSWSPDGSTIVYDSSGSTPLDSSGLSPTQEIWSVPAAGGTPVRLTNNHTSDQAPSYSPDGTKIAFFEPDGITEMDADGRNVRPVAGASGGWTPRWSPDGSRIAFLVFSAGKGSVPDPRIGPDTYALPLGAVKIGSVATGEVTSLPVQVTTSYNAVSWMPSSDALLVNRYQQP